MVDVRPFRGLRYSPARVGDLGQVLAPPYDVISADERRELLEGSDLNVVRLELPAADAGDAYTQAAETLAAWRSHCILSPDEAPCFYLYEVRFRLGGEERVRRSLVTALRLEPWTSGQVLPHEQTMAGPKADRLRLLQATRANISPLWTLYRGDSDGLDRAWERAEAGAPDADCRLGDGTSHRLWKL